MEKKLTTLFDYQKFEGNSDLRAVIDSVHSRYAVRELSLDEMEWVSAAGLVTKTRTKEDQQDANRRS